MNGSAVVFGSVCLDVRTGEDGLWVPEKTDMTAGIYSYCYFPCLAHFPHHLYVSDASEMLSFSVFRATDCPCCTSVLISVVSPLVYRKGMLKLKQYFRV